VGRSGRPWGGRDQAPAACTHAGRGRHRGPGSDPTTLGAVPGPLETPATTPGPALVPKLLRYLTGSVVATVCSEVVFVLLYGALGVGTTWSSLLSWVAGAIPNFWLNRSWAWQRKGRPDLRREVLPYVSIILATLVLATILTHLTDVWLHHEGVSSSVRVTVVAIVYLGTYVVVFALRFVMLERLFAKLDAHERARPGHDPYDGPEESR
jgi:putative flippase GtrA